MSHLTRRPKKDGIYWTYFYKNGKLHGKSLKTKDYSTAKYLQAKIDKELAENKYVVYESNPPCENLIAKYEEATEHYKVEKSLSDDLSRIRAFVSWSGITKISQITEEKFQDYLNHRISDDKITLNTANRIISSIKAWLNFAVRRKVIFNNPVKEFKKYRPPQNPPKFLTKDEIERILMAAKNTRLYAPIFTALYTGMRKKELYTLEWQDIDFEQDTIMVKNKDGFTTKSKKFRSIPLHNKLKEFLLPLRKEAGKCFNETNHKHSLPDIIEEAKLKGIGFHHFRHTFASHLALAGVDLYTIAQILGHSSIAVTQQYAHLTKGHTKTAVEKLNF